MQNIFKKATAVLLGTFLLIQGNVGLSAQAIDTNDIEMYTHVVDATDANGNNLPDYYLNSRGQVVDNPTLSDFVTAQEEETFPAKYDGRTGGYLTSVKNQAGAGSCWAFSTVACLEADYVKKGFATAQSTDFSEAHLTWFAQRGRFPAEDDPTYGDGRYVSNPFAYGGNWYASSAALMRGSGLQLEKNAPWTETYSEDTMLRTMSQPESDRYVSYARMTAAHPITDDGILDKNLIKKEIMEHGAVTASYYEDNGEEDVGFNKTNSSYYQKNHTDTTNHMITVVGWDDSFSRTKFNTRPSSNGAWLIKGSYGTTHGKEGGYYWISYEEPSMMDFTTMEADKADIFDNIYQYDGSYTSRLLTTSATKRASMANTFVASRQERITHVAFFSENAIADVTAEIYVSDTKPSLLNNNPTYGMTKRTEATTTVKDVRMGYSTIELAEPVRLSPGQYFTVNIVFQTTGDISVCYEGTGSTATETSSTYTSKPGQSFFSFGSTWYAADNFRGSNLNNVPVKAMTVNETGVKETLSILTMPNKTAYLIFEDFDMTGLSLLYSDSEGVEHIITDGYTLSANYSTDVGPYTLTITYKGLDCTLDLSIEYQTSLTVLTPPTKQTYLVGEPFDFSGLTLSYADKTGSVNIITEGYTVNKTTADKAGTCTVTISYAGLTCTVNMTAEYKPTLSVKTLPTKTTYLVGETFSWTGLSLFYTSKTGSTRAVSTGYTVDKTSADTAGICTVTITYAGLTCTVDLTIEYEPTLTIESMPTKTAYLVGEAFDWTGLTLTYKDKAGNVQTITTGYTVDKLSADTAGTCTVTITYAGLTCTVDLTAEYEPTLTIDTLPTKTEYKIGETPDLTGLVLTYTDEMGESHRVTSGYEAELLPCTEPGKAEITVHYMGTSCTLTLTVTKVAGDANGDGRLSLMDTTLIVRYLVGGYNVRINESYADVDNDGEVTLMDAALIRRYLAGGYNVVLQ